MKALLVLLLFCYSVALVLVIGRRGCVNKKCVLPFALGMVSFLSVFIVQIPLQNLLKRVSPLFGNVILSAILYAAVAGFVQEFFKMFAALSVGRDVLYGIASGAGFGISEVIYIFAISPVVPIVSIIERLFGVMFHISGTGLIMKGKNPKQIFFLYVLISVLHTAVDTVALLFQMRLISLMSAEFFAALVSVSLFAVLFKYSEREILVSN